jgi:transcriptional antiterminator NusG
MVLNDDTWHLVKETPRVMGFIGGTADRPAPITQREVDGILDRLEEAVDKPAHKTVYERWRYY